MAVICGSLLTLFVYLLLTQHSTETPELQQHMERMLQTLRNQMRQEVKETVDTLKSAISDLSTENQELKQTLLDLSHHNLEMKQVLLQLRSQSQLQERVLSKEHAQSINPEADSN